MFLLEGCVFGQGSMRTMLVQGLTRQDYQRRWHGTRNTWCTALRYTNPRATPPQPPSPAPRPTPVVVQAALGTALPNVPNPRPCAQTTQSKLRLQHPLTATDPAPPDTPQQHLTRQSLQSKRMAHHPHWACSARLGRQHLFQKDMLTACMTVLVDRLLS